MRPKRLNNVLHLFLFIIQPYKIQEKNGILLKLLRNLSNSNVEAANRIKQRMKNLTNSMALCHRDLSAIESINEENVLIAVVAKSTDYSKCTIQSSVEDRDDEVDEENGTEERKEGEKRGGGDGQKSNRTRHNRNSDEEREHENENTITGSFISQNEIQNVKTPPRSNSNLMQRSDNNQTGNREKGARNGNNDSYENNENKNNRSSSKKRPHTHNTSTSLCSSPDNTVPKKKTTPCKSQDSKNSKASIITIQQKSAQLTHKKRKSSSVNSDENVITKNNIKLFDISEGEHTLESHLESGEEIQPDNNSDNDNSKNGKKRKIVRTKSGTEYISFSGSVSDSSRKFERGAVETQTGYSDKDEDDDNEDDKEDEEDCGEVATEEMRTRSIKREEKKNKERDRNGNNGRGIREVAKDKIERGEHSSDSGEDSEKIQECEESVGDLYSSENDERNANNNFDEDDNENENEIEEGDNEDDENDNEHDGRKGDRMKRGDDHKDGDENNENENMNEIESDNENENENENKYENKGSRMFVKNLDSEFQTREVEMVVENGTDNVRTEGSQGIHVPLICTSASNTLTFHQKENENGSIIVNQLHRSNTLSASQDVDNGSADVVEGSQSGRMAGTSLGVDIGSNQYQTQSLISQEQLRELSSQKNITQDILSDPPPTPPLSTSLSMSPSLPVTVTVSVSVTTSTPNGPSPSLTPTTIPQGKQIDPFRELPPIPLNDPLKGSPPISSSQEAVPKGKQYPPNPDHPLLASHSAAHIFSTSILPTSIRMENIDQHLHGTSSQKSEVYEICDGDDDNDDDSIIEMQSRPAYIIPSSVGGSEKGGIRKERSDECDDGNCDRNERKEEVVKTVRVEDNCTLETEHVDLTEGHSDSDSDSDREEQGESEGEGGREEEGEVEGEGELVREDDNAKIGRKGVNEEVEFDGGEGLGDDAYGANQSSEHPLRDFNIAMGNTATKCVENEEENRKELERKEEDEVVEMGVHADVDNDEEGRNQNHGALPAREDRSSNGKTNSKTFPDNLVASYETQST